MDTALQSVLANSGTPVPSSSGPAPAGDGSTLGKDDFLKLMIAQMTSQDPLQPTDSAAMMQQVFQMGSIEQLANLVSLSTQSNQLLQTLVQQRAPAAPVG